MKKIKVVEKTTLVEYREKMRVIMKDAYPDSNHQYLSITHEVDYKGESYVAWLNISNTQKDECIDYVKGERVVAEDIKILHGKILDVIFKVAKLRELKEVEICDITPAKYE